MKSLLCFLGSVFLLAGCSQYATREEVFSAIKARDEALYVIALAVKKQQEDYPPKIVPASLKKEDKK